MVFNMFTKCNTKYNTLWKFLCLVAMYWSWIFVNFLAPDLPYSGSACLAFYDDQMYINVDVRFIIIHLVNVKFHFYVKEIQRLVLEGNVKNNSRSIDWFPIDFRTRSISQWNEKQCNRQSFRIQMYIYIYIIIIINFRQH